MEAQRVIATNNALNDVFHPEVADLLRKHGGKTRRELKAEGK